MKTKLPTADETPLVTAVILNWNRPDDTVACLDSLAAQNYPRLQTVVVDNGSTDDSVARIQAAHPGATLIAHGENSGFARGVNLGMARALADGAEYLFLLNNDTYLAADTVALLVAEADAGLVAPIIYYADAPTRVWSLGGQFNPWLLETTGSLRGTEDAGQWPDRLTVDFVPACALLIRRDVLAEIGHFDERFFIYYEDLDFCLRARQSGRRIQILTQAKLWHKVSLSSGGGDSPNERYWMGRSSVLYFRKHARWRQLPLILCWRLGSAVKTTWRLMAQKKWTAIRAYWRGLWDGLRERV